MRHMIRSWRFALPLALVAIGCGRDKPGTATPAAKVENPVTEGSLATVTLSAEAEQRLRIVVVEVAPRRMSPSRVLPGELLAVPGNTQVLVAPVAGRIVAPASGAIPLPGTRPRRGDIMLRLVPIAPDRDLMRAGEELEVADVRLKQAQLEAERAGALWRDRLISARDREVAEANLGVARAARDAAAGRARQAEGSDSSRVPGGVSPLLVRAPFDGVLQRLLVGDGQIVAAGTPLLELSGIDDLWVRVQLYIGDLDRVDVRAAAAVRVLGSDAARVVLPAVPVPSNATADPASASADLHYRVRNRDRLLRPGARVEVAVPLRGAASLVRAVPWSAVVFDAEGGTWVYERTAERRYTRRRVLIGQVTEGWAEVRAGLATGAKVVTDGAAELFGTEFGAGK